MMEKGAKNLLVVSRNAASHPKASSLSQKAEAYGCNSISAAAIPPTRKVSSNS
jgi:hypothetical protein